MSSNATAPTSGWQWRREWRWLLVFAFIALLPAKTLWNFPVVALAIAGLVLVSVPRLRGSFGAASVVPVVLVLFALVWLPMLASLPGAVNLDHSGTTTAKYLRFAPALIGIALLMNDATCRRRLNLAIFILLALWCADAFLQSATGENLFGYPLNPQRVQGVFHPRYRLGVVLAVLAPLWFECIRQWVLRCDSRGAQVAVALGALPLPAVVLLSGTRSAWLMLGGAVLLYGLWLTVLAWQRGRGRHVLAGAVLLLGAALAVATTSDGFRARLAGASAIVGGDFAAADAATSYRLSIWKPALAMWTANPVTGIGPRGFRYAFEDYAEPDNFWRLRPEGRTTHPHSQWLEVAVETGSVGAIGLAALVALLAWLMIRAVRRADGWAVAWCGCLALAWWPTNVHSAVYAGFWASMMFWIAAIAVASTLGRTDTNADLPAADGPA